VSAFGATTQNELCWSPSKRADGGAHTRPDSKKSPAKPWQAAGENVIQHRKFDIMREATESSLGYKSFDNPSPRSKKLGEAEAHRVVEDVCREVLPQIELALEASSREIGSFHSTNALYDATKFAQDELADLNPHKVSPEDLKKRARRALQIGFARSFPDSVIVQFPGMRAAPGAWKPKPWTWHEPETIARLDCLFGDHYWRGEVVSTVAPGGVGKSLLSIVEALAMITGRPLLGEATRGALRSC
jgi:hypothetical protein